VWAAAGGGRHPAAGVAPPQTLMGCSPIVAAAQTLSYTIILTEYYEGLLDTKYIGLGHAKKLCFGLAH
jgi:hypothetical protein